MANTEKQIKSHQEYDQESELREDQLEFISAFGLMSHYEREIAIK